MKHDFIIYGNKLISLFIGDKLVKNINDKEEVLHHSDYALLMNVVEEINSSKTECFVTIFSDCCKIHNMYPYKMNDVIVEAFQLVHLDNGVIVEARNTKEAIFIAIVKFLEWYNTQNNEEV